MTALPREGAVGLPSGGCAAPVTAAVTGRPRPLVYRWTDENGRQHFSDTPPPGTAFQSYDPGLPEEKHYFDLRVEYPGRVSVPFLKNRLEANATRIYEALSNMLGEERLKRVELTLSVYADQASFLREASRHSGLGHGDWAGFYSHAENRAVTYRHAEDATTLAVAMHESVHVMVAGMLGASTPLWLNEGLADYFSGLEIRAQLAGVALDPRVVETARRAEGGGYPARLTDFLEMDREEWYGPRHAFHYALAHSLVWFLMDSNHGRQALGALLREKADHYCREPDQRAWLSLHWPGGAEALHREFRAWLARGPGRAHRY